MKANYALAPVLAAVTMNLAFAQNKQGEVQVDKVKKEVTVNLDKTGTYKVGAGEGPKLPDAAKTERDRRQEQQEMSGKVFLKKTFP